MDRNDIQEFADKNGLDVRQIEPWHYRLMDEYGRYIVDVFIKKDKRGDIVKNTVCNMKSKKKKWGVVHNHQELKQFIK